LATALFWGTMLISPPTSEASRTQVRTADSTTLDPDTLPVPPDLPRFEERYRRHIGVLEKLDDR
jgi:hypothetical protein